MPEGYLPPVVVRLVAETAEAIAQLERFTAALGEIGARAQAAGAEVDAAFTGMAASAQRVDAAMAETSASVDRMATSATAANERAAASYNAPTAAADRFAASADADMARVAAAQDRVAASSQTMAAKMEADSAKMQAENAKMVAATEKVGTTMEATSAKSGVANRSYGLVALGAVAVGVEALKMAGNFQQATDTLVTTAGEDRNQIDFIRKSMLDLSSTTGTSAQAMVQSMYLIESSHIHGAEAVKVLTAAVQGAKVENSDLTKTTDALTTTITDFHFKTQDAALVMSKMTAAVGGGKLNMEQFAGSLHTVENVAERSHLSFEQMAGALATLTLHGQSADQATQNLRNAIQNLMSPNQVAIKEMAGLGINALELSDKLGERGLTGTYKILTDAIANHTKNGHVTLDLMNTSAQATEKYTRAMQGAPPEVQKMAKALHDGGMSIKDYTKAAKDMGGTSGSTALQLLPLIKNSTGFSDALKNGNPDVTTFVDALKRSTGGTQGLAVALGLTGENAKAFQDNIDAITNAAPQADGAVAHWDDVQQRFNQKVDVAKESLRNLVITIGSDLIPVVGAVLGPLASMADWLSKHSVVAGILAGVISGVLVAAIVGYTAKMVIAAAQTAWWAATIVPKFLIAAAQKIAGWAGLSKAAQENAVAEETAAAESEAAVKTAADQMVATWKIALSEMLAATRAQEAQMAAAAEQVGQAAGEAEQAGMRAGIAAGKAQTIAAGEVAGAEAGAAEAEGMAGGIKAGTAGVAAAGATAAGGAATASKAGWLLRFASKAGEVGLLLMGADMLMKVAGLPTVTERAKGLVDEVNHAITGDALSPSTSAMEAWDHRISNSVRDAAGLAKLYSDDGTQRINTTWAQGAKGAENAWRTNLQPIPGDTQQAVDGAKREADKFPNAIVTPTNQGADEAKQRVGKMPGEFSQAVAPMPGQMKTAGGNTMQGFKDGSDPKANEIVQNVIDWAKNLLKSIGQALGIASPSTIMRSIGVDFMQGFWDGIQSLAQTIANWVTTFVNNMVTSMKSVLGIASPSRVMHEMGEHTMRGFHDGLRSRQQDVLRVCQDTARLAVGAFSLENANAHAAGWAGMQGFIDTITDQDMLGRAGFGEGGGQGAHKNQWGCWVCGQTDHVPLYCPNRDQVLTLTRSNSGIGVQDSTTQAGNVTNITVQGAVLDHQGLFQALQEAALRVGQRNSFTGGFGSPR